MKKNIFYSLAHQDDEFGVFIDIFKNIKNFNIYVIFLTSGYKKKLINPKFLKETEKV